MGLFGGSKTYVGTSISRVIQDSQLPQTVKASTIRAIFNDRSIANSITEGLLNGGALQVDRMYDYAKKHYKYGLPNASFVNSGRDQAEAKAYLQSLYSEELNFEYIRLEAPDPQHIAWQVLTEEYGFDFDSNEIQALSSQLGYTVYLDNMKSYHYLPEPEDPEDERPYNYYGSFSPSPRTGYTPERRAQDERAITTVSLQGDHEFISSGETHVKVFYVYTGSGGSLERSHIEIPLTDFDEDVDHYQAMFHSTVDGERQTAFFTYEAGSGEHPTLDTLKHPEYVDAGSYFPFLFFRRYHEREEASDSTVKLAKYLGLSFEEFNDSIHENPDIDDVRHAVLMMGVPANSNAQPDLKYLFKFFNKVHAQDRDGGDQAAGVQDLMNGLLGKGLSFVPKAVVIQDGGFKFAVGFQGIGKRTRGGSVTKVGEYSRKQGTRVTEKVVKTFDEYGAVTGTKTVEQKVRYQQYRLQISPHLYEEITVLEPSMRYDVYKSYDVVADAFDSKLLIPVDKEIVDGYNLIEKEQLYFRSMHLVFNSKVKQKLKWYESGIFKFVMIVVAIVATIYSGGTAAGMLSTAFAQGMTALALAVIQIVVVSLAVNYAFKLAVKELGAEVGMILAVVAAVVSVGMRFTGTQTNMITPERMMMASTGFGKGVAAYSADMMTKYDAENQAFELEKENKIKDLETAQDLLETDNLIDPFEFIGMEPFTVFGEDPDSFYNRTIHSGNIGTMSYEHIHNYVDINLQLPDFNKTMGELV